MFSRNRWISLLLLSLFPSLIKPNEPPPDVWNNQSLPQCEKHKAPQKINSVGVSWRLERFDSSGEFIAASVVHQLFNMLIQAGVSLTWRCSAQMWLQVLPELLAYLHPCSSSVEPNAARFIVHIPPHRQVQPTSLTLCLLTCSVLLQFISSSFPPSAAWIFHVLCRRFIIHLHVRCTAKTVV